MVWDLIQVVRNYKLNVMVFSEEGEPVSSRTRMETT